MATPPGARGTLPTQLAAVLSERGHLAPGFHLGRVDPLLTERVLAHVSAHTGVDIPAITEEPDDRRRPPAVIHARVLAAALLRRLCLATWDAIAGALGGTAGRLSACDRAYRRHLVGDPGLARELEMLARRIRGRRPATQARDPRPHRERMGEVARSIVCSAQEIFGDSRLGLAERGAGVVACRAHTDLTWDEVAELHGLGYAARAVQARRRATARAERDPEFSTRSKELVRAGRRARVAAGYRHDRLGAGLAA